MLPILAVGLAFMFSLLFPFVDISSLINNNAIISNSIPSPCSSPSLSPSFSPWVSATESAALKTPLKTPYPVANVLPELDFYRTKQYLPLVVLAPPPIIVEWGVSQSPRQHLHRKPSRFMTVMRKTIIITITMIEKLVNALAEALLRLRDVPWEPIGASIQEISEPVLHLLAKVDLRNVDLWALVILALYAYGSRDNVPESKIEECPSASTIELDGKVEAKPEGEIASSLEPQGAAESTVGECPSASNTRLEGTVETAKPEGKMGDCLSASLIKLDGPPTSSPPSYLSGSVGSKGLAENHQPIVLAKDEPGLAVENRQPAIIVDNRWPVVIADNRQPAFIADDRQPVVIVKDSNEEDSIAQAGLAVELQPPSVVDHQSSYVAPHDVETDETAADDDVGMDETAPENDIEMDETAPENDVAMDETAPENDVVMNEIAPDNIFFDTQPVEETIVAKGPMPHACLVIEQHQPASVDDYDVEMDATAPDNIAERQAVDERVIAIDPMPQSVMVSSTTNHDVEMTSDHHSAEESVQNSGEEDSADAPFAQADDMTAEQEAQIIQALLSLGQTPVFGLEDVAMLGNEVSAPGAGTLNDQPMLHGTGSSGAMGPSVVSDGDASCAPIKFAFSGNPGRDDSPVWSFSVGSLVAGNGVQEKPLGDPSAAGMKHAISEPFVFGAPAIEAPSFDFVPSDGPVYPGETFSMFLAKLNADQLREVENILRQEKEAGWPRHYGNAGHQDPPPDIPVPDVIEDEDDGDADDPLAERFFHDWIQEP